MAVFISGSVAYDTILTFEGEFAKHASTLCLPGFNLTFQTSDMKRQFGGCAANTAFSLKSCGGEPYIATAVGLNDCQAYFQYLLKVGIRVDGILTIGEMFTPQAFITTDVHGNQLASFHEGAMNRADLAGLPAQGTVTHGLITSTAPHVMRAHTQLLKSHDIPVIWDAGPSAGYLDTEMIDWMLDRTDYLTVSEAEWALILEKSKKNEKEIRSASRAIVITRAANGCELIVGEKAQTFEAIRVKAAANPVGCGDAFRGGFLRGLELGKDLDTCVKLAQIMGSVKAQVQAPQGYSLTPQEVEKLYEVTYGEAISLA